MPTRYFIENNQKTSYLAFDASELHVQVIKKRLNDFNALFQNAEIRCSIRVASNGEHYPYYIRLRKLPFSNQIDSIFHDFKKIQNQPKLNDVVKKFVKKVTELKEENRKLRCEVKLRKLSAKINSQNQTVSPKHILREEMISALLSKRPTNKNEFCERIPEDIRRGSLDSEANEYLNDILLILDEDWGVPSEDHHIH